jgi:hypothetical protein
MARNPGLPQAGCSTCSTAGPEMKSLDCHLLLVASLISKQTCVNAVHENERDPVHPAGRTAGAGRNACMHDKTCTDAARRWNTLPTPLLAAVVAVGYQAALPGASRGEIAPVPCLGPVRAHWSPVWFWCKPDPTRFSLHTVSCRSIGYGWGSGMIR